MLHLFQYGRQVSTITTIPCGHAGGYKAFNCYYQVGVLNKHDGYFAVKESVFMFHLTGCEFCGERRLFPILSRDWTTPTCAGTIMHSEPRTL